MLRSRIRLRGQGRGIAVTILAAGLVAGCALVATWPAAVSRAATGAPGSVTESGNMATIAVGGLPTSIAADPVSGTVWVVNSLDNTVSEISAARRAVIATIKVAVSPVDVAVDQKTGTVWVTCLGPVGRPRADNLAEEISEASGKVVASFRVGLAPFGVAADPHTGTIWVADSGAAAVSEISEARQAVVATIHTGPGTEPASVAVDPVSGVVWVANLGGLVEEVSETSRAVTADVKVKPGAAGSPGSLNAIAAFPGSGAAWVASDSYAGGSYLSYASEVPRTAHEVNSGIVVSKPVWYTDIADGIAVDPATGTAWVAENGGNTVTMISAGSGSVARNLITGEGPVAVAVDQANGTVWTADNTANTVTEYSYSSPEFTTPAQVILVPGKQATVQVHTQGFPIAIMTVHGAPPPGMRVRIGEGTVGISGRPKASARGHVFRLTISAGNGVGTPEGQYVFTQQLAIQVGQIIHRVPHHSATRQKHGTTSKPASKH
jgi:YVTN family beta-propeller protein